MALSEEDQDLLWGYWSEEIDGQENMLVEKRLADDQVFAYEYRQLVQVWQYSRYAGKWERIDPEKAWRKIEMKRNGRKRNFLRYCVVAASVVFIIGIGSAISYHFRHLAPTTVQVVEVLPGSPKAKLILASGEKIDLGGELTWKIAEQGVLINGDTASLKYEAVDESGEKALASNELVVPRGGEYSLLLSDGTKVWLNADSRLKYPVAFARDKRKVWLEGEAYFEVAADSSSPFMVETAFVGVKVLGTGFNVMAYRNEDRIEVTLVHGKVDVETAQGNALLKPREQLVFQHDGGQQEVREVNVNTYISWKEGVLAFDAMPLSELADRLGRWYNIDFFFTAEDVKLLKFSGAFRRYDDIQYVLTLISETTDVQFVLKNRTVMVYKK